MKNLLTLFCMLVLVSIVQAQDFTFYPEFYKVEMTADEEIKFGFTMENTSEEILTWYWSVDLPEDFPEEWQIQICDTELCYLFDNVKSSNNLPNTLDPGEVTNPTAQYVKVRANGVLGDSYVIFNVYGGQDCTNLLYSTSSSPVSSNDIETPTVKVFPNPTTAQINLQDDANVSKVVITSVNGQSVYSSNHETGQSHNIENVPTGMYIISLYNSNDRLMKMQQLYKK